ncbi:MAG: S-layer homology domain-containing protein [Oscillibacter sp.]|nr:S-layer homology domain-containing protein [Oscillibacter sp.]
MKRKVLALLLTAALGCALACPAFAAENQLPFTDVSTDYWAYSMILYSYQNNLVKGKTAAEFQPESPMTVGQYLTVLYRIGVELKAGYPDKATTGSNWLEAANYMCTQSGTVLTEAEMYLPVTREEMAYFGANMVASVCQESGTAPVVLRTGAFADSGAVTAEYLEAVNWFYSIGGIGGYPDGTFRPQGTLKRSQAVTVFYNIFTVIIPNLRSAATSENG